MLIDLFINAGWHTVPLQGKLERLPDGYKTVPHYPINWKENAKIFFSQERTELAGALTGECSGIIAIDCDNQATYDMFRSLDPENIFHFVSEGKPEGGGTIIYRYKPELQTFKIHNEVISLDFFSDEGFIYLPTEANKTKMSWQGVTQLPPIREVPITIETMIKALHVSSKATSNSNDNNKNKYSVSNRLAPMLESFVELAKKKDDPYDPVLFKILTPKSFRDLPLFMKQGHIHPNDIPQGLGSEYLMKVSAILGADISVSIELYTQMMYIINSMWASPMERAQLNSTIINPMIEGRSTVDGDVIWQYDEYWESMGFVATAINGDYLESFFDDVRGLYYLINYTVPYVKKYTEKRPLINVMRTLLGSSLTDAQYDRTKQLIRTEMNPSIPFGHVDGSDRYNLFSQSKELSIITNPEPYASEYKRPVTILKYFETLIPDEIMRNYVLSFLRTKFCTFKFSPVVLYLIGVSGSGKDTLANLVRKIIGKDYVARPEAKVFLEQYNGWFLDKYFVQLDEYGNKINTRADMNECLGKIKSYTGNSEVDIRAMRTENFSTYHQATFIITANSNPLPIDNDDRRIAFIKTPNELKSMPWVIEMGGMTKVFKKLEEEILDFCFYLGTEVPMLSDDAYVYPPFTDDKFDLIFESMSALDQIFSLVNDKKWDKLKDLADDYEVDDFDSTWKSGRLMEQSLIDLYSKMTEGKGSELVLRKKLKEASVKRRHTTKDGRNVFYYFLDNLHEVIKTDYGFKVYSKVG